MFGGGYSVSSRNNQKLRSRQSYMTPFSQSHTSKDSTPLLHPERTKQPIHYTSRTKKDSELFFFGIVFTLFMLFSILLSVILN